jgi:hypothetical protein
LSIDARRAPFGAIRTDQPFSLPKPRTSRPLAASHNCMVLLPPDRMRARSDENPTEVIQPTRRSMLRRSLPVAASQSLIVLSAPPDTSRAPSGEKTAEITFSEWPATLRISLPVAASQSRMV